MSALGDRLAAEIRSRFGAGSFDDLRAEAGRRWPGKAARYKRPVSGLAGYAVHHTAGGVRPGGIDLLGLWSYAINSAPWADAAGVVRRGWDTGNYAIGISGGPRGVRVQMIADPETLTYHVGGPHNAAWLGVNIMHDCVHYPADPAELRALYEVLCALDDIVGNRKWRGHREIKPTACPGDQVMSHLRRMRGIDFGAKSPRPPVYKP